ncbi:MAG: DUF4124 domain-containing protein [Deltaproteobacteria bacterium]|nr:DUF4124 domain-containing protein [Deltaproteobacteria bacterium]
MNSSRGWMILEFTGFVLALSILPSFLPSRILAESRPESDAFFERAEPDRTRYDRTAGELIYKWTDEDGNLCFTNDLARVPCGFRNRIETVELPLQLEEEAGMAVEPPGQQGNPLPASPSIEEADGSAGKRDPASRGPCLYREIPFDQFIRIRVGMDEAEVLSRLGLPSLVTPSDYFYGEQARYKYRIIRLIYLGNRDLNQKTTVVEIRNGTVVEVKRIFPF